MRLTDRAFLELEQLPERVDGEVPLCILLLVDDARGERLLAGLPLEDLFLDRARRDKTINEA